ncbi:MAG: hypothetical protein M3443_04430 [Actinomycetota bacterium]|nr:hypothetical protein [Actinomycetota bacterium]
MTSEITEVGIERLPDEEALRSERDRRLWEAFNKLPSRYQELLRLMVLAGRTDYHSVAEALRIPHGPTRGRGLAMLRALYDDEESGR